MRLLLCLVVALFAGLETLAQPTDVEFAPNESPAPDTASLFRQRTFSVGSGLEANTSGMGAAYLTLGSFFGERESTSLSRFLFFGVYGTAKIWGTLPVPQSLTTLQPTPRLELWHAGFLLELTLLDNGRQRLYCLARAGWGIAAWKQDSDYPWGTGNPIGVYEPGAGFEVRISRLLTADAQVAYRWINQLSLVGVRPSELNDWQLRIGLRLVIPQD